VRAATFPLDARRADDARLDLDRELPVPRRISDLLLALDPALVWYDPTAQARRAETAATAERLSSAPRLGLLTRRHVVPFHRTTRVLSDWLSPDDR
jgi:hypothetical protein